MAWLVERETGLPVTAFCSRNTELRKRLPVLSPDAVV